MSKLKSNILIIDNSISFTGAFKCALTEAGLLRDQHTFIFVVPKGSTVVPVLQQNGFTYYELPFVEIGKSVQKIIGYVPRLLKNAIELKSILKKEKVDILQVNDFYNLLGVAVKILGCKNKLITYVRLLPAVIPLPLRKTWIGLAHRYGDAVVAVSDAVLHQLPTHVKNIKVYDAIVVEEKIKRVIIDDEKTIFLYISNYIEGKGQNYALQAFARLVQQDKNVVLKLVGGDMGLEKNKLYKKDLQQLAIDHNIADHVVFESFQADIEATIKGADVVLNFSEAESFSMTCAESCYYGIPVIATCSGGPQEIIVHQKTGLLVQNRNIDAMYEAMLKLAGNQQLRKQYGEAASAYVKATFSKDAFIKSFETLLKKIEV